MTPAATPVGLLAGFVADRVLGDPRRWHPVAGFGTVAAGLERLTYRDCRVAGALHVGLLVGAAVGGVGFAARLTRHRRPSAGAAALTGTVTWAALGGRSLRREAAGVAVALGAGDLADARRRLPALCARDPATLDAAAVARATVESVAENTSDAVVAPLWWGALAGPPGAAGYRAVNTLDAMIGYRTRRYRRFGWAAARFDDAANWLPARLTAGLVCLLAPVVGGSPGDAWRAWLRDARHHPSPNAGPVEAAFAGALGRRLGGGENRYGDQVDRRPTLGDGPAPTVADIHRAIRLADAVGTAAALLTAAAAAGIRLVVARRRPRSWLAGRPPAPTMGSSS